MRVRMNGGVIGPTNPTTLSLASGVYSVVEAQLDKQNNAFPLYQDYSIDTFFNRNRLLVHADGSLNANNNSIVDSSSQATVMTRTGTTTQGTFSPFSQTGWSNYFNGSTGYLTIPNNTSLGMGAADFTIEFWLYQTALSSYKQILDVLDGNSAGRLILWVDSGGTLYNLGYNGTSRHATAGGAIVTNTWTHVALVRSSGTTKFYINGTQSGTSYTDSTNYTCTTGSVYIGINSDGSTYPYVGYLSNFRMVKGTAVYTSNFNPPTTALTSISGTSLLTCQSNRFIDNSSSNFALTPTGSPSVQPFSPFAPAIAYGVSSVGGSISAITTSDAVTATLTGSPGTGDFSIEFWLYPTSYSSTTNIVPFALGVSNAAASLSIFFSTVTPAMVFRYGAGGSGSDYTIGSVPKLNTWTHYAFCRSSGVTAVYVNGVLTANTGTAISGTPSVTATAFAMFALSGLSQYLGFIAGVRYISGDSAYTAAFTPPTAPVSSTGNTLLLLNGTNGSIYDSTAKNNIQTSAGGYLSTTQAKFGGSSIRYPGSAYHVTNAGPQNSLGNGDFTIEMWIWFDGMGSQRPLSQGTYTTGEFLLIFNSNGSFDWCEAVTSRINSGAGAVTVGSSGGWYHIAIVRSSGTTTAYVNGSSVGTPYTPGSNYNFNATTAIYIGGNPTTPSQIFSGYIDDLRITIGAARYTANFAIPTTAYPNQ